MEKSATKSKSRITRKNYSRVSGALELPNLVEIQTNSYKWFKEEGIKEVFNDVYPISNFNETLTLNIRLTKVKIEMQIILHLFVLLYV